MDNGEGKGDYLVRWDVLHMDRKKGGLDLWIITELSSHWKVVVEVALRTKQPLVLYSTIASRGPHTKLSNTPRLWFRGLLGAHENS